MNNEIELTKQDLQDYAAIKKYAAMAKPKQVKWIKEMLDMARQCGVYEPVGENVLSWLKDIDDLLVIQTLRGYKSAIALQLKERRTKPTAYEVSGQMNLFHPEAFQGGDNPTLREV